MDRLYVFYAESICKDFGVSFEEITNKSRGKEYISDTRHVIAFCLYRNFSPITTQHIGKILGGRDHSTIINSIRRVQNTPFLLSKAKMKLPIMLDYDNIDAYLSMKPEHGPPKGNIIAIYD